MMKPIEALLRPVSRAWEIGLGLVMALIGISFATLLIWLGYLVAREYGAHEVLIELDIVAIMTTVFIIAVLFLCIGRRLLFDKWQNTVLLAISPLFLRVCGIVFALFAIWSFADFVSTAFNGIWLGMCLPGIFFILSLPVALASFMLARSRARQAVCQDNKSQSVRGSD